MKLRFFVLIIFSIFFVGVTGQEEEEDSEPEPEPEGEPEPEIGKYNTQEYFTRKYYTHTAWSMLLYLS